VTAFTHVINGELADTVSGGTDDIIDNTTGQNNAAAPMSDPEDVDRAYVAAAAALHVLGLSSSLWTKGDSRAMRRWSRSREYGVVWINSHLPSPGYGKDLSMHGFEDYTRIVPMKEPGEVCGVEVDRGRQHIMTYFGD
jgi:acyl-CoA reductase-like NAD-dependent aldehyde dehydrogenase